MSPRVSHTQLFSSMSQRSTEKSLECLQSRFPTVHRVHCRYILRQSYRHMAGYHFFSIFYERFLLFKNVKLSVFGAMGNNMWTLKKPANSFDDNICSPFYLLFKNTCTGYSSPHCPPLPLLKQSSTCSTVLINNSETEMHSH